MHTHTHLVNTDSPVRPGHSDRVSPHPERRRFWKTDRDGLETQKLPLYTRLCPQPCICFHSQHRGVSKPANIVFDCQHHGCVYPVRDRLVYSEWGHGEEEDRQPASREQKLTIRSFNAAKKKKTLMGWSGDAVSPSVAASLTNHSAAPGQAAQSQQPQHRQLRWQGPGLSYGLHFLFAQGLEFFLFFLSKFNLNVL